MLTPDPWKDLDTTKITVTNIDPLEMGEVKNGQKLSNALSRILSKITDVNLSIKSLKSDADKNPDKYVAKEAGKDLSTNDFTDEYKGIVEESKEFLKTKDKLIVTDTNHIRLTNVVAPESGEIQNGDTVTTVINKLNYQWGLTMFKLKTEYLDKGQINDEYIHKIEGKGFSTNDFSDEYKTLLDNFKYGNTDNVKFYSKDYMDDNFIRKDPIKGLSTYDFTSEYKTILDNLSTKYLSLTGGDLGDSNIKFGSKGGIKFYDSITLAEIGSLDKDFYTGASKRAMRVGNIQSLERNKEYEIGDCCVVDNLDIGYYLYCTYSGTTAVLEPGWNIDSASRTTDGTARWQVRKMNARYDSSNNEIPNAYLPLAGGTLTGNVDFTDANSLSLVDGTVTIGSTVLSKSGLEGNADTATKLKTPFHINGIEVDGSTDITIPVISSAEKGQPNGIASLDANGKVPADQLPSFVKSVVNVNTYADLPNPGDTEIIYITDDNNQIYRWGGSSYINVSPKSASAEYAIQLTNPRRISLSGSVTGFTMFDGSTDVTIATTLGNVNSSVGVFGTAKSIPVLTVQSEGRITNVTNTPIALDFADINAKPTTVEGYGITNAVTQANALAMISNVFLPLTGGTLIGSLGIADNSYISCSKSVNKTFLSFRDTGAITFDTLSPDDSKKPKLTIKPIDSTSDTLYLNTSDTQIFGSLKSTENAYDNNFIGNITEVDTDNINTLYACGAYRLDRTLNGFGSTAEKYDCLTLYGQNSINTRSLIQIDNSEQKMVVGGFTMGTSTPWVDTVPLCKQNNVFEGSATFKGEVNLKGSFKVNDVDFNRNYFSKSDIGLLIDTIHPVGSVYKTTDRNFDPATIWQTGTWTQLNATESGISSNGMSYTIFTWIRIS